MVPSATRTPLRGVVLDAMGVIYEARDDVSELLVPFARSRGSGRTDAEIHEIYRRSSLGELTTAQLWQELGMPGATEELDEAYLRQHRVREGLRGVLDELGRSGLRLVCISNDVAQWSRRLRELHGLDRLISHWTVSGEVGARKPDSAIYAAFGRATGLAYADCVFIDDQPRNLDAAAQLGFRTLHFQPMMAGPCCGHEDVHDLSRLAAWIAQEARRCVDADR